MNAAERIIRMREASKVERCHTLPHHGSYTNGQHSFDMMTLAYALMPHVTTNILLAIMVHDLPERWTGDMPSPAKESDGEFGKLMGRIEDRISKKMGWKVELHPDERFWLHALDKLEFTLWCYDQLAMGNKNVAATLGLMISWFNHNEVPQPVADFVTDYEWTRTPDHFPFNS